MTMKAQRDLTRKICIAFGVKDGFAVFFKRSNQCKGPHRVAIMMTLCVIVFMCAITMNVQFLVLPLSGGRMGQTTLTYFNSLEYFNVYLMFYVGKKINNITVQHNPLY